MDAKTLFDAEAYFRSLCEANLLAVNNGFTFCTCSGMESLQGPLDRFKTCNAFFCLDDTNDGAMVKGRSGGWFMKRTLTVFLLHRHKFRDEADRTAKLGICRTLFRQLLSRMIVDADDIRNEMIYLDTANVLSREFGQYFMNGCTGLYFMIDVSEPVDLKLYSEEWSD